MTMKNPIDPKKQKTINAWAAIRDDKELSTAQQKALHVQPPPCKLDKQNLILSVLDYLYATDGTNESSRKQQQKTLAEINMLSAVLFIKNKTEKKVTKEMLDEMERQNMGRIDS